MRVDRSSGRLIRPLACAIALALALAASCASGGKGESTPDQRASVAPNALNAAPDAAWGKVYGEFEDAERFERALATSPEKASWSAKQLWDGLSGATLQNKDYDGTLPDRLVLSGGEVPAYADGFGQYWLALPPGRYALVGRCRGYRDCVAELTVEAGSTQYLNFFMRRR